VATYVPFAVTSGLLGGLVLLAVPARGGWLLFGALLVLVVTGPTLAFHRRIPTS
jgi:hypothetical protein